MYRLPPLEADQKRSVLMELVLLVYLDGTYSEKEKSVLDSITNGLCREVASVIQKYIETKLYAVEDEMIQSFE